MKAFKLLGKMISFSRLVLQTDDLNAIKNELSTLNPAAAAVPLVIDSRVKLDLSALTELLWEHGLQPIGVVDGVLSDEAKTLRLAIFPADGKRVEHLSIQKQKDDTSTTDTATATTKAAAQTTPLKPADAPADPQTTKPSTDSTTQTQSTITSSVHNHMLRSGQSLQHIGGDLVVIGGVNNGAEAITDCSLHIYGHGQGRLVAGATGDKDARIFCQKFNPTLVSVAGTYCLQDAIPKEMLDKAVQVSYDEQKGLVFSLIH